MSEACPREAEVVEAVGLGGWPVNGSRELAGHVASCTICRDVATVAAAMREDYEGARKDVRVPAAGLVWWRAQLRARQRHAEAAARPIIIVQAAAACVAAVILFTLGGLLWPSLRASVAWIDRVSLAVDMGRFWLPIAVGLGAWLVLAPVMLLFALSDD